MNEKQRGSQWSRRDFLRLAAVGAAGAVSASWLAGCGPKPTPAPTTAPPTEAAPEPSPTVASQEIGGKLTVWGWANPWLQATSELFVKEYPDVEFEFVDMSWQDTHQKFSIASAAGSGAPDVLSIDGAQMQNFVKLGGLLDITEAMTPHVKNFPEYKIREASNEDGQIFAVPWDVGPVSLFYRKDIFEQNDIELPVTWDEYIEIGQKLAEKGHYMMSLSLTSPNPQDSSFFQKLLWQAGGSYFDRETGAVTLDNDAGVQAMEMYAKIAFSGITVDIPPFTPAWFGAWKEDKIVTDPGAGWMLHVFVDNIVEGENSYGQWRIADQLPAFEKGGTPTSNLGGSNVAISNQTKNPATAIAYSLFTCASNDGQSLMAEMGTFPSFYPVYEDPRMKDATAGVYGDQKFNQPFIALADKVPNTYWRDSAFPQADVIVNAGLIHILEKTWTPEEGIKILADQIRSATLRA